MMTPLLLALAVTPPTFPIDYYTGEQSNILQAQGEATHVGAKVCCGVNVTSCQVKAQSMGADKFVQGSQKRFISEGRGITLTWNEPVHKMMALVPGSAMNSTHKWACALYCPETTKYVSAIAIAPKGEPVRDLGKHTITQTGLPGGATKQCEAYGWTEKLLVIPLALDVAYVDESVTPALPFKRTTKVTMGWGPPKAFLNQSYVGFTEKKNLTDMFDIDMASVKSCPRQKMGKCPHDHHPGPPLAADADADTADAAVDAALSRTWLASSALAPSLEDLAVQEAARLRAQPMDDGSSSPITSRALPTFAPDSTEVTYDQALIAEGTVSEGASVCCDLTTPECQLQRIQRKATVYRDVTNQRLRSEYSDGTVMVDLFDNVTGGKSILVNMTGGVETCASYCPLPKGVALESLHMPTNAKDLGQTTIGGKTVEHYHWEDRALGVIKMSETDFYATLTSGGDALAVPFFESTALTPLGREKIGTQNRTWLQYKVGTPPAAKFDIKGLATCKMGRCRSSAFQAHRLASGQMRVFERYYTPA